MLGIALTVEQLYLVVHEQSNDCPLNIDYKFEITRRPIY